MWSLGRVLKVGNKKLSFTAGLVLAVAGLMGSVSIGLSQVSAVDNAKDCDQNAIIHCGFTSASDFISKVKANSSGGSPASHDLQAIYAKYGLEPADYDKFVTSAQPGLVYKDGTVKVGGVTVATGANTFGRQKAGHGSNPFSVVIGSTTYWGNITQDTFAAQADSLPAEVMFNSKGVMQFAVLMSCGNPVIKTKNIVPNEACTTLHKTPVTGQANTYSFTTSATAGNGASIASVTYDFGDGTTKTVPSPTTAVTHTYSKAGTFTAKVSVNVKLPGNQTTIVTSATCQTVITVVIPSCVQLNGAFIDKDKMQASFTAKAQFAGGGVTFTSADFNFGDGNTQEGVKPSGDGTVATVTHTYAKAGTFNATAVLHFNSNGTPVTAAACAAVITPTTPPTPECKPNVPVGSPECIPPCQPGSSVPPESPQCTPPTLPNTGAGNTIAIFAAVVIAGFLVYRQLLFRQHKAAFLAAEQGSSPLPLGDPLSPDAPLAGTPLAPVRKHHSLRRKRRL